MVGAELSDDQVIFSVVDKGPGIPQEFISKIFQKFNQADSSSTRGKGGTGLGLSIAKALVEQHDGDIGFETSSKGTRFYFTLAVVKETLTDIIAASTNSDGHVRLLICEDDPDIATLLTMMLKEQGYDSDVAQNAEQALLALSAQRYDALLLDLTLPGKSGFSLMQELRAAEETCRLPIIVISAIASEAKQRPETEAFHVIDWFEKPINVEQLSAAISSLFLPMNKQTANVLYLEDDASLGLIVVELLRDAATVRVEGTLAGARKALGMDKFDLVILDIQLPDGSGLDLIPQINAIVPEPPPIIVLSAQDLPKEFDGQVAGSFVKANSDNDRLVHSIKKQLSRIKSHRWVE